ncbi:MAG: hypothetical protein RR214_07870, partial [Synergistaceae bacterium]
ALAFGLPFGGSVILPEAISNRPAVMHEAQRRKLTLIPVAENKNLPHPLSINVPLALEACTRCFLDKNVCFNAMMSLPPDIADSSVIKVGMGALAFAFSVNDTESTEEYFASLGWARKDTVLLYNHRHDRVDRLASFSPWFDLEWREKYIIGDSPLYGRMSDFYLKLKDIKELACFIDKKERVFGCGNAVYGLPLKLKLALEKGRNVL